MNYLNCKVLVLQDPPVVAEPLGVDVTVLDRRVVSRWY